MERLRGAGCPVVPTSLEEGVKAYVQTYLTQADQYR